MGFLLNDRKPIFIIKKIFIRYEFYMSVDFIETHPFPPFVHPKAKMLMSGSFPPPRSRWHMAFYYPNFYNDMWRIFGLVFFEDKNYFVDKSGKRFDVELLRDFLVEKHIALSDTAHKARRLRDNASDKFLEVVQPYDLEALLGQMPDCKAIMTTGELATDTLLSLLPEGTEKPKIGHPTLGELGGRVLGLYRLPSSSRAYPLALEKKAAIYGNFLAAVGVL